MGRFRTALPLLAATAVVIAAVLLLGFSASVNPVDALLRRGPLLDMPDVTGRTLPRARADLAAEGLEVEVVDTFSVRVPRGAVARTRPRAGVPVRAGTVVTVAVSKGVNSAVVPPAVGRPVGEVTRPLRAAGIRVRVVRVFADAPDDEVLSVDPDPGTLVRGRDVVVLRVSRGPRPRRVPEVVGLTPAGAGYRVGEAGLRVGSVTEVDDPDVPVGAVAATRPAVGTTVARDTPVDLLVSRGPAPVALPDVVGRRAEEAVGSLEAAGFVVGLQSRPVPAGSPLVGVVLEQAPAAATPHRPGQVVVVTVGRVPVPVVTTTTTTTLPPPPTLPPPTLPPTTSPRPTAPTTAPPTTGVPGG